MYSPTWYSIKPFIEITLLWIFFYYILVFFQGTRAFQILKGFIYLLLIFLVSHFLDFDALNWILRQFFAISIVVLVILFQQEIRQGFARLGQGKFLNWFMLNEDVYAILDDIEDAVFSLSEKKIGCIMAIEKQTSLKTFIDNGVAIDGMVTSELIQTIFKHESLIHDGGIILRAGRIAAAACLFPLSENQQLSKIIGTRHRAALGLTEQTDAVVVIVSEETGDVSLAYEGRFIPVTGKERFKIILKELLVSQEDGEKQ